MVKTLEFAEANASPAVRAKLLSCAVDGNDDLRVHAAALVHFLYGASSCHFDMKYRRFYLRFGSPDESERRAAHQELCAKIGIALET